MNVFDRVRLLLTIHGPYNDQKRSKKLKTKKLKTHSTALGQNETVLKLKERSRTPKAAKKRFRTVKIRF